MFLRTTLDRHLLGYHMVRLEIYLNILFRFLLPKGYFHWKILLFSIMSIYFGLRELRCRCGTFCSCWIIIPVHNVQDRQN